MRDQVGPLLADARTIAEVGPYPGLILATPARPLMPSVYPLDDTTRAVGLRYASYFASHPADVVLIYIDSYLEALNPYGPTLNPYGPSFRDRYTLATRFTVGSGILEVFRYKGQ